MTCREERARQIAWWAYLAVEGAEYLRSTGNKRDAKGLRRAVEALLDHAAVDVGRDVLSAAMTEICARLDEIPETAGELLQGCGLAGGRMVH